MLASVKQPIKLSYGAKRQIKPNDVIAFGNQEDFPNRLSRNSSLQEVPSVLREMEWS